MVFAREDINRYHYINMAIRQTSRIYHFEQKTGAKRDRAKSGADRQKNV
jgi:hypothetical protein